MRNIKSYFNHLRARFDFHRFYAEYQLQYEVSSTLLMSPASIPTKKKKNVAVDTIIFKIRIKQWLAGDTLALLPRHANNICKAS